MMMRLLLDKQADVNSQGGDYDNALYTAPYEDIQQAFMMSFNKDADSNVG